jgi:hypothetical protein
MAARLKRHIEFGAASRLGRVLQRLDLRVRFTSACMIALADDSTVPHDDRANHRVRTSAAAPLNRKNQGALHKAYIVRREHQTSLREAKTFRGKTLS